MVKTMKTNNTESTATPLENAKALCSNLFAELMGSNLNATDKERLRAIDEKINNDLVLMKSRQKSMNQRVEQKYVRQQTSMHFLSVNPDITGKELSEINKFGIGQTPALRSFTEHKAREISKTLINLNEAEELEIYEYAIRQLEDLKNNRSTNEYSCLIM